MNKRSTFTEAEFVAFAPAEKIGLVASINPENRVHVTLITSIMAAGPDCLTIGQFCMGRSKWHMQNNPNIAFLVMSLDRKMWRGKARWTHKRFEGPEYEFYNNLPMFRYNAYFGINTVHYLDPVEISGPEVLPMARIVPAAMLTRLAKGAARTGNGQRILKPFGEDLFNRMDALKFIAYLGDDGFPVLTPAIQCQACDSRRLVFSTLAYPTELRTIRPGTNLAVFCLNLKMQSVLVRGTFKGFSRLRMMPMGLIDIEWVYNSMPPCHEQIYPPVDLEPVTVF
jgi:hypothetical protein